MLSDNFYNEMKVLRDEWIKDNLTEYLNKFKKSPAFRLDTTHNISAHIAKFSGSQVIIFIVFKIGHIFWRDISLALKNYLLNRNDFIDSVFNLKKLEEIYSFTFKDVGYGTPQDEMFKKLGNNFYEHINQATEFGQLYYEEYDLEIIMQGYIVKYLLKGRPSWMDYESEIQKNY